MSVSLIQIKDLGAAIDAAAGALGKLADSVAHMIFLGDKGYNIANARKTKNRLKDIDARLTDLAQISQSTLVDNMLGYAELWRRLSSTTDGAAKNEQLKSSWQLVVAGIRDVLLQTRDLVDELRRERSDFVLQPSWIMLIKALDDKASLLNVPELTSPPDTDEKINELEAVAKNFEALRNNTIKALTSMSDYISKVEVQ
jgi:hypothetical protein